MRHEDIRGQILPDKSMTIPSPAGDNEQQSKRIQNPIEQVDAGTNTRQYSGNYYQDTRRIDDMNAQMVETLRGN